MMNIAVFIPTIQAGGAEKQAVILARSLAVSNRVFFIVYYGNDPQETKFLKALQEDGIPIIALLGSSFQKMKRFRRILIENHIEVAFNYLTLCDGIGAWIEHRSKVRLIFNGIRSSRLSYWKEVIERLSLRFCATASICNSYCAADYFGSRGFNKDRLVVIQNCFEVISSFFVREKKDPVSIITIGRFDPAKDYETSIKTVAKVRETYPNIQYFIVGHGILENKVRSWITQYGLSDITAVLINPDNIFELLNKSDIFLSTSLYEGTSNAIMEALNSSLPVVCTSVGDNPYLVENDINGYVCNVGDVDALSSSLARLVSDYDLRISFGKASNTILSERFSYDCFSDRLTSVIQM